MRHGLALALVCVGVALGFAPPASASPPLVVDNDHAQCPHAQYTTIQSAVNAAAPGSRILVCAGTYHEQVTIATAAKNGLRLKARGRRGRVVLDGTGLTNRMAGFWLQNVSRVRIEGFSIRGYHEAGILLDTTDHAAIVRNRTTAADHDGIELRLASHDNLVRHNVAIDNLAGNACGVQIRDAGSVANVVRHNRVVNNNWGIRVGFGATNNVVHHNRALRNRAFGILDISGNGNQFAFNRAQGNPIGIAVQTSTGVLVAHNDTNGNAQDGVGLIDADNNTFRDNRSNANGRDGIRADVDSEGNMIVDNHMRRNGEHDCHDDSVGGGTAGTANFWINDHGQTENRMGLCRHGHH